MADLEIQGSIKRVKKGHVNFYYGGGEEAWTSKQNAYTGIPPAVRKGQKFAVIENGILVEYWWRGDILTNGAEIPYATASSGGGGGDAGIDDYIIGTETTWSSNKISFELDKKMEYEGIEYVNDTNGNLNI